MHNAFGNTQALPQGARGGSIRFVLIVVVVAVAVVAGVAFWRAGSGSGNVTQTGTGSDPVVAASVPDGWRVESANGDSLAVTDRDGDSWACNGAVSVETCEIAPSEGNALWEPLGWPTRAGALANCPDGTVGEIWRKGSIAGWACELQPIVE